MPGGARLALAKRSGATGLIVDGAKDRKAFGMTIETIRERIQRKDFRNCDLHMADGRIIHVATPDHIFISPTNCEFVVFSPPPNEWVQILDVELVTGLTEKPSRRDRR